jgi:type IV pilus assembly protein PilW
MSDSNDTSQMNRSICSPMRQFRSRQISGFSLVELMVAMAIGLVLLSVVGAIFLSSKSSYSTSEQRGRVNEASRLVHDVLGAMVRQTGYVDIANTTSSTSTPIIFQDIAPLPIMAVFGCSDGRIDFGATPSWSCIANTAVSGQLPSDSIAFSYQSQPANAAIQGSSVKAFAGGIGGDCNGNNPATANAGPATAPPAGLPIAINEFYVGRGITTTQAGQSVQIPELYCLGNGGRNAAQPIAQGVEQLRAFFHVSDGIIGKNKKMRRVNAAGVGTDWPRVEGVDFCLVMQSPSRAGAAGISGGTPFVDCDGNPQVSTDNRLRKATWFSFNFRNRTNTNSVIL